MLSVGDLRDYRRCRRRLWLYRKAGIEKPNIGYSQGRRFHSVINGIANQVRSVFIRENVPGIVVGTEVQLEYGGLRGRLDILRKTNEGYIIHEEKYCEPPRNNGAYELDELQLNGYAYLGEKCGYEPIKSLYVIYNDIRPREIAPRPYIIPPLIKEITDFLESMDLLPEAIDGLTCRTCSYYPLCQVLPESGGIRKEHLAILAQKEADVKLLKDLEECLSRAA
jgi:CRISPR/Cas system-associated exonuclease Cas4 (RecB family)